MLTDGATGGDFKYMPTYRDADGNVVDKSYPGLDVEFDLTEEEANEIIEYWFDANVLRMFGEDDGQLPHTVTGLPNKLNKLLEERQNRLQKGKSIKRIQRQVENAAKALRKLIRVFAKSYYMYAPILSGNYVRSSIIYFTNDEASRQRALQAALTVNRNSSTRQIQQYIFGQRYVLDMLGSKGLSTPNGVKKIMGGISIENVAFVDRGWSGDPDKYFYGWRRVEMWGWRDIGGPGPYKPFQHALKHAINECKMDSPDTVFSYSLHQEAEQSWEHIKDVGYDNFVSALNNMAD